MRVSRFAKPVVTDCVERVVCVRLSDGHTRRKWVHELRQTEPHIEVVAQVLDFCGILSLGRLNLLLCVSRAGCDVLPQGHELVDGALESGDEWRWIEGCSVGKPWIQSALMPVIDQATDISHAHHRHPALTVQ